MVPSTNIGLGEGFGNTTVVMNRNVLTDVNENVANIEADAERLPHLLEELGLQSAVAQSTPRVKRTAAAQNRTQETTTAASALRKSAKMMGRKKRARTAPAVEAVGTKTTTKTTMRTMTMATRIRSGSRCDTTLS